MSLALSLCQYVLRPWRGLAQASPGLAWLRPGLGEPRSASIASLHQHNRKGKKISDICGEMNPLVFSALEEVNLVFTLMVSSTVMVDIVFARFMFCTFYWR